jgi:uncharacterized protein (DUF849 family)
MDKRIITAAITGGLNTPTMSPYLPITPKQIADEAVRARNAGAAVVHIHVRDPETGKASYSNELFREVLAEVKSRTDVVVSITTGGSPGMTLEQRIAPISVFGPELGSLNFGSLNFSLLPVLSLYKEWKFPWEPEFFANTDDNIFSNSFKTLREFCTAFKGACTKPELEIYDLGMINNVAYMIQQGHLDKPVYLQFVLGALGGIPATMRNLMYMEAIAKETLGDFVWSVCAGGRHQMRLCTTGLLMGGNARVGLEDSLYLEKGRLARSNAEQAEKIVRIAREIGIEPATPDEARELLGLKGTERVNF